MRPTLNVLSDELIDRILDESMDILATTGMEIRGPAMRQRLVDAGLPQDPTGRVLFPRAVVERANHTAPPTADRMNPPPRRSGCSTATANRTPTWGTTGSISCRARAGCASSTTGPARLASRTRPTSSSTSGWPTA